MKVYKFKSGLNQYDFESLENNYYWASNVKELNDVFESTVDSTQIDRTFEIMAKMIDKDITSENLELLKTNTNNVLANKDLFAIFSTSKDFKNELLWAHYANSHKGFCIEYDLNRLQKVDGEKNVIIQPIKYKSEPPKFNVLDLVCNIENQIANKVAFCKSKAWGYEKELRILTMKHGKVQHPFDAITGIYFGINSSEELKKRVKEALKNHSVDFYGMNRKEKSYLLSDTTISRPEKKHQLKKILSQDNFSTELDNPEIISYRLFNFANIGELKISVNNLNSVSIKEFEKLIISRLFPITNKVFIEIFDKNNNLIHQTIHNNVYST